MTDQMVAYLIRPYYDSDFPSVKAILKNAGQHDENWDHRENLASMIKKDAESVQVAESDGEIVGCIIMVGYGERVSYLFRLSVKDSHKNQGIGSKLLDTACDTLKKRGTKEVDLIVEADRKDLKAFYEKRGYKTSGRKFIYMWKSL